MVIELSNPKGLPTASTRSPGWRTEESPSSATGIASFDSNDTTARSRRESVPTTFPLKVRWSLSFTLISVADSTTWLLVRTYTVEPVCRTMIPDPRPFSWYCRWSPWPSRLLK